jgi:hypothetical protein
MLLRGRRTFMIFPHISAVRRKPMLRRSTIYGRLLTAEDECVNHSFKTWSASSPDCTLTGGVTLWVLG